MSEKVYRLCFIKDCWAYFTTQEIEDQWGDDWNDAPYEHNAGSPYEWRADANGRGCQCVHPKGYYCYNGNGACGEAGHIPRGPVPEWKIEMLAFTGPFETPSSWTMNSPYSVQDINTGQVPWLKSDRYSDAPRVAIFAGASIEEFCETIRIGGGSVYLKWEAPISSRHPSATSQLNEG